MNKLRQVSQSDQTKLAGWLTISTFKNGELIRETAPMPNKVVTSDGYGRNLLLRQLAGITTFPIVINTLAVGSGTTAPVDANIALQTPLVSNIPITEMIVVNNVLTVKCFVVDANLANGTYAELGLFCSLRLFARILISPTYTKTTGEDTLFTYTSTFAG